jgi:predicted dehydrogenase
VTAASRAPHPAGGPTGLVPRGPPRLPPLRWGIAGYGDVVRRRGFPAFRALRQPVTCVWGRDPARAAAVAASYGAATGTDNFDVLLARADAVYIATPVLAHVPLTLAAISAGLHVLVEKPVGGRLTYDRAGLLAAAQATHVVTAVAYYRRLAPAMIALRDLLAGGPYRIAMRFRTAFAPARSDPMYWRTLLAVAGGGVLADAGCHRIDLLCWLFGVPAGVLGRLDDEFPGGAERRAALDLTWADGTTARLSLEWAAGQPVDRMDCTGPAHRVRLPQLDSGWLIEQNGGQTRRFLPAEPNGLIPVLRDFLRAVDGDGRPSCSLPDGVVVDDVIRAASRKGADQP